MDLLLYLFLDYFIQKCKEKEKDERTCLSPNRSNPAVFDKNVRKN